MSRGKPRLAFISPLFLFPNDAGGKIRTTNILRGMKGGAFDITLLSPASQAQEAQWRESLMQACDRFTGWKPSPIRPRWMRSIDLFDRLPVNVLSDRTPAAVEAVAKRLAAETFDLVVFDFVHSAVLRPDGMNAKTLCFTHNVEAEIFARHETQASNAWMKRIWASQHRKMERFEAEALSGFTSVVAVSERDARFFREHYAIASPVVIPTGVDLEFFSWQEPPAVGTDGASGSMPTVVFTGVMDWAANIDGIEFFLADVWPLVKARIPQARLVVVGRNPPASLINAASAMPDVNVTGFVDDVRPYVRDAHAFVIPLRVGGGTRIKAFEAMAMGCPVVSTAIGIEGLDIVDEVHYLRADAASDLADALVRVLQDADLRLRLSRAARRLVEEHFGHAVAARAFEEACLRALVAG